ncbi:MAG: hypothetical protein ACRD0S_12655, partial [Acidimicrobiales bacterium]
MTGWRRRLPMRRRIVSSTVAGEAAHRRGGEGVAVDGLDALCAASISRRSAASLVTTSVASAASAAAMTWRVLAVDRLRHVHPDRVDHVQGEAQVPDPPPEPVLVDVAKSSISVRST